MKTRIPAIDIVVDFNGYRVVLPHETDRATTSDGVEIWIQQKPANNIRPMATLPEGTLDKFKHCRPVIISNEWDWPPKSA